MIEARFTGAELLLETGFEQGDLSIADGRIQGDGGDLKEVDLSGFRVLPGIVDLHGDGFERHVAPRRGALRDVGQGILATEAELASNGITTAWIAQFWSWEGGMRGPDFAERVFEAVAALQGSVPTDLHMQLRLETHLLDEFARAESIVALRGIDYVVFNDHLQHARLAEGRRPKQLTGQALKSGRSPEAHLALMQALHDRHDEVPSALDALGQRLVARGVRLGSHDDRTDEDRAAMRARGAHVAEFPETLDAARAARTAGDAVVMGAPNVMRAGSHKGNVSAHEIIREGLCDALASDYHYPAPRLAALSLVSEIGWTSAWRLVSEGPARVMGFKDRGRIELGMRADLLVLDAEDRVAMTVAGGVVSYASGPVATRLLQA
ncbi:alpha-D-ribose 1-methylphosphonate 5-triphosphate diphosphatase [Litorisediminicola beolgyonensis]|uniref:Alpha-D-ribose 1-methylphosphonate 5-triphosphate diphosphatase n=1 Tax=Litorisediminicola beolgyonensis TaxID=1173614 RepID=A0ABW3ZFJ5_9RHOB